MDTLDTNAQPQEPQRRPRGRPRLHPLPPSEPQQNPQQPQQLPPPQQSGEPSISGTDNFETVAASVAPVIGDGTAAPGAPAPGAPISAGDESIQKLLSGITPANVEKYATAIFDGVARGFKMPELALAEHEKPILCPALQVIAEKQLPEILKALAAKYGDSAPEYALLATFVVAYASRVALAQATKEKKSKDGEKPWGKSITEKPGDTSPQAAPVKPWGRPEVTPVGTMDVSTTRGYQALPDSLDNPAPENLT
jgi:hypothetical protein